MNKLFEDLARAVGKALAKKWMNNLRQQKAADDLKKISGTKRASRTANDRLENSKDS
jgi:hypothetical protein